MADIHDDIYGLAISTAISTIKHIIYDNIYGANQSQLAVDITISKVDFTAGPDKNMYGDTKAVYTSTLETVTNLLVEVHRLNAQAQDGVIDELNYQLEDLVKWLKTQ